MDGLHESEYTFTTVLPNDTISLGVAEKRDVGALAAMYREVYIGKKNYLMRLDPNDKGNFSHTGGMFNALSEAALSEILEECDSKILTAKLGGTIVGMLWVSGTDPAFSGYAPEDKGLKAVVDSGKVLYFRDIIVARTAHSQKIPFLLIYAASRLGGQMGCTHALAEIYKVTHYNDGVWREVGLLNDRSFNTALSSGGCLVGALPPKTVWIDDVEVGILSSVLAFDNTYTENLLKEKITALGIKVEGMGL